MENVEKSTISRSLSARFSWVGVYICIAGIRPSSPPEQYGRQEGKVLDIKVDIGL